MLDDELTDESVPKAGTKNDSELLLSLLDSEINQIISEQKKPGWTLWALYVGISTVVWTILQQIVDASINVEQLIKLYVSGIILLDSLKILDSFLTNKTSNDNKYRYRYTNFMHGSRSFVFYQLLLYSLIIFLYSKIDIDLPYNWIGMIYISIIIFVYLLVFSISYMEYPINLSNNNKNNLIYTLLILSLCSISIFYCMHGIDLKYIITSIDLKISILLIVLTYLFGLLINNPKINPYLSTLIDIRRMIALKQIDNESARKQIDISLNGMKASDLYSSKFNEIINKFIVTENTFKKCINTINGLKAELLTDSGNISATKKEICISIIDKLLGEMSVAMESSHATSLEAMDITKKIKWMVKFRVVNDDMVDEIESFVDKISKIADETRSNYNDFMKGMAHVCREVCDKKCEAMKKYL